MDLSSLPAHVRPVIAEVIAETFRFIENGGDTQADLAADIAQRLADCWPGVVIYPKENF